MRYLLPVTNSCRPSRTRQVRRRGRFGVSLLEVMFSIGVVMIGLVGIAALLPVAGRAGQQGRAGRLGRSTRRRRGPRVPCALDGQSDRPGGGMTGQSISAR